MNNVTAYRWILHEFASDPHGVITSLSELHWKHGVRIPTTDRHFLLQNVQSGFEAQTGCVSPEGRAVGAWNYPLASKMPSWWGQGKKKITCTSKLDFR